MRKKKILVIVLVVLLVLTGATSAFILYRIKTKTTEKETLLIGQPFQIEDHILLVTKGKSDIEQKKYTSTGQHEIQLIDKSLHVKQYIFDVKSYEEPKETNYTGKIGDKITLNKQKGLSYTFTSSDPNSFSVNEDGEVCILKQQASAIITAMVNGYKEEKYTFSSDPVVVSLSETKLYIGEIADISISGYDGNIEWDIAGDSITTDGKKITAVKQGVSQIKCEIGGKEYSYTVEVYGDPEIDDMELLINQEKPIQVKNIIDDSILYKVEDTEIASVKNGKITALASGKTKITGKIRNKEFSSILTVKEPKIKDNDKEIETEDEIKTFAIKDGETFSLEISDYGKDVSATPDNENVSVKAISEGQIEINGVKEGISVLNIESDGYKMQAKIIVYNKNAVITQKQWMQEIKDWCDYMINDGDWIYSNSDNRKSVDQAINESHTTNCALMVVHAMQRAGVLSKDHSFYSGDNHEKKGSADSWKEIRKNAEVIDFEDGKTVEEANLQQGDICLWNGHVNIFAGYDQKGKQTWYDAGSRMTIEKKHGGTFANFFKTGNRSKKLYSIIRIHYVPESID